MASPTDNLNANATQEFGTLPEMGCRNRGVRALIPVAPFAAAPQVRCRLVRDRRVFSGKPGRIVLDVTNIARWTSPPVGILRVEQALARYALAHGSETVLSFYDPESAAFLGVDSCWAEHVVGWDGGVSGRRGRLRSLVPTPYALVGVLNRMRSTRPHWVTADQVDRVRRRLIAASHRRRQGFVPFRAAIGHRLALQPQDVVFLVSADWNQKDAHVLARLKKRFGFRYAIMCHDIIPLLLPQYFATDPTAKFRQYWEMMFSTADWIFVNSRRTADDVSAYCRRRGISSPQCRVVPLGYDPKLQTQAGALPPELAAGRFILFVSTLEPRKGHALLLRVWERLLAANVPQRHGFKLVFAGRCGWQMQPLLDRIGGGQFADTVLHLGNADDAELSALYRAADFCVYPSQYEGFGLPVVEGFAFGKAVIASTGGALPETVGDLSPCLDPNNEEQWFQTLRAWIENPAERRSYEEKIQAGFRCRTWNEAAAQIFAMVREEMTAHEGSAFKSPAQAWVDSRPSTPALLHQDA